MCNRGFMLILPSERTISDWFRKTLSISFWTFLAGLVVFFLAGLHFGHRGTDSKDEAFVLVIVIEICVFLATAFSIRGKGTIRLTGIIAIGAVAFIFCMTFFLSYQILGSPSDPLFGWGDILVVKLSASICGGTLIASVIAKVQARETL